MAVVISAWGVVGSASKLKPIKLLDAVAKSYGFYYIKIYLINKPYFISPLFTLIFYCNVLYILGLNTSINTICRTFDSIDIRPSFISFNTRGKAVHFK